MQTRTRWIVTGFMYSAIPLAAEPMRSWKSGCLGSWGVGVGQVEDFEVAAGHSLSPRHPNVGHEPIVYVDVAPIPVHPLLACPIHPLSGVDLRGLTPCHLDLVGVHAHEDPGVFSSSL